MVGQSMISRRTAIPGFSDPAKNRVVGPMAETAFQRFCAEPSEHDGLSGIRHQNGQHFGLKRGGAFMQTPATLVNSIQENAKRDPKVADVLGKNLKMSMAGPTGPQGA